MIIYQSLLIQEYFIDLTSDIKNKYISNSIYDTITHNNNIQKKPLNLDNINIIKSIIKINDNIHNKKFKIKDIEQSTEPIKPVEEPNKEPNEEPNEKPNEEPNEKPNEEPNEEPNKEPNEEPNEKPNEEPNEEPDDVDEPGGKDIIDEKEYIKIDNDNLKNCIIEKYKVREKVLKDYFNNKLYEILHENNINVSINMLKNILLKKYKSEFNNLPKLKEYILRQKHIIKMKDIKDPNFDLDIYILSDNYYITIIDLYILLNHYNIPFIFVSTTFINNSVSNNNFILGNVNRISNNYYMIKVNSQHTRLKEGQIYNYKLLSHNNDYKIDINTIKDTPDKFKENILQDISMKTDLFANFLNKKFN
jgi:hypothetical protein